MHKDMKRSSGLVWVPWYYHQSAAFSFCLFHAFSITCSSQYPSTFLPPPRPVPLHKGQNILEIFRRKLYFSHFYKHSFQKLWISPYFFFLLSGNGTQKGRGKRRIRVNFSASPWIKEREAKDRTNKGHSILIGGVVSQKTHEDLSWRWLKVKPLWLLRLVVHIT